MVWKGYESLKGQTKLVYFFWKDKKYIGNWLLIESSLVVKEK